MTYDYNCDRCSVDFEKSVRFADRDDMWCPRCNTHCERLFTPTANIHIPSHFGMDRGWHLPDRGVETGVLNATVKPRERKSFKETVEPLIQGA